MKRILEVRDDAEGTNYWFPSSNIIAVFMLVLVVVIVAGFVLYTNASQEGSGQQVQEPIGTSDKTYLAELKTREEKVKIQEKSLSAKGAALDEFISIRSSIIKELSSKLESLKIKADIDEKTGSVRFGDAVLFDVNSIKLSASGEAYLKKLVPAYLSVVLNKKNKEYIEKIIIEGHADDGGTYLYNLALSQSRSYSVAGYLITSKITNLSDGTNVEKLLAINGKSFSEPVIINGITNKNMSRRVELKFALKYDNLVDQIQNIIKDGEK